MGKLITGKAAMVGSYGSEREDVGNHNVYSSMAGFNFVRNGGKLCFLTEIRWEC